MSQRKTLLLSFSQRLEFDLFAVISFHFYFLDTSSFQSPGCMSSCFVFIVNKFE